MKNLITLKRFTEITNKFSSIAPIVVVGDVGIDKYTFGEVKRISPEAPVPVLEVTKEWLKLGLAANISHNLKTLGVQSTLCGVVGEDNNANVFDTLLEDEKLNTWGIVRTKSRPTIFKERVTTNTQQICRIDYESSEDINEETEKKLIARFDEFAKTHGAVIIEDYAKGSLTKNVIAYLIAKFKEEKKLVAVDPGKSTPPLFYKGANLLKPNLLEAKAMVASLGYKENNLEAMASILVDKLELDMLVITLGGDGMALLDVKNQPKMKIIPTVANEVFDVSGAGDTAISALTSSLLAGATLEEAAWIGNCASGVVVAKKGTATVDLKELHHFYNQLAAKMSH
ncbi:PfkB family carbohydrate kinase [Bacteriovorax sp. PP10]|uniref:PfkB family carbohydrate kinase n=1 Tax=Bacteriovorax antarcticus TaxID=3088717 RepID=A0ABU5VTZ1_9BACT|nr:PfkB family carbohydrate kinase [Bacteriovorax sp. PP10]MEA9356531.1 PfkB family carbohydrate kinase [Bacteriovorax sp. PP10]